MWILVPVLDRPEEDHRATRPGQAVRLDPLEALAARVEIAAARQVRSPVDERPDHQQPSSVVIGSSQWTASECPLNPRHILDILAIFILG
jgi:hypothetical protein